MKITAENPESGTIEVLARPRTLKAAAARLKKDGNFWYSVGWEHITLEGVTLEMLKRALVSNEITFHEYRELFGHI